MSEPTNHIESALSDFEELLNARSTFGGKMKPQRSFDEEDILPVSVGVRDKRPGESSHTKRQRMEPLKAPELDSILQRELRDVPALKHDFSNEGIEKMLGITGNRLNPSSEEFNETVAAPVPDRDVRSLYFKVDEDEFVKVEESNFKGKKDDNSSVCSSEDVATISTTSETSSDVPYITIEKHFTPLRIRNAAILGLLKKAELRSQDV